jgi:pimeloyl-ACP methyl ester carboxylesterase
MTSEYIEGRYQSPRVELAYLQAPGKEPPILTLHGFVWARDAMLPFVPQEHERYAYDARGHGASGRTQGAYRFLDYGTDAADFLRDVVGRPAIIVGHSLGGLSALYAAALCPDLVLGLYLADPTLHSGGGPGNDPGGSIFTLVQMFAGRPEEELLRVPFLPPMWRTPLSRLDPDAVRSIVDGSIYAGFSTEGLLGQVKCPVLLLHGDRRAGSGNEPSSFERARKQLKDAKIEHIPGTGHEAWLTQPEAFAKSIREFVERVT